MLFGEAAFLMEIKSSDRLFYFILRSFQETKLIYHENALEWIQVRKLFLISSFGCARSRLLIKDVMMVGNSTNYVMELVRTHQNVTPFIRIRNASLFASLLVRRLVILIILYS